VRLAVREVDPDQPLFGLSSMEETLSRSVFVQTFPTALIGVFAIMALALATVGVYGVLSCAVSDRTREIGVLMALGADPGDVVRRFVRRGLFLVGAGVASGLPLAFVLTRLIESALFGVGPGDPVASVAALAVLASVAALACYVPARRAAGVDPLTALRHE
jgi:putative ABC transport system permease protein